MSRTLTETELDAWRAKRTGKPVAGDDSGQSVATNAGGGPGAPRTTRTPVSNYAAPAGNEDDNDGDNDDDAGYENRNQRTGIEQSADELRQQLAAANGRLAPAQRQVEEMRAAYEAQQRQLIEMQTRLAEQDAERSRRQAEDFDPFAAAGLTQDEIDMLDPVAANLIKKTARAAYHQAASKFKDPEEIIRKTLEQRDAIARDTFIRSAAEDLDLVKLGQDPKFNRFVDEDGAAGMLITSFLKAPDQETARALLPNVRKVIKRFEGGKAKNRQLDPQDRLSQHLSREGKEGETRTYRPVTTPEEARQVRENATRLTRARRFKEADALLASLNN